MTSKTDNSGSLSQKQRNDVQSLRQRMNAHLIAESEMFYKEHPELQLAWILECHPIIRGEHASPRDGTAILFCSGGQ